MKVELVDACNGYYLWVGDKSACLGDGVDRESKHEIGTEEFRKEWEDEIKTEFYTYIDAYFAQEVIDEMDVFYEMDMDKEMSIVQEIVLATPLQELLDDEKIFRVISDKYREEVETRWMEKYQEENPGILIIPDNIKDTF